MGGEVEKKFVNFKGVDNEWGGGGEERKKLRQRNRNKEERNQKMHVCFLRQKETHY